MSLFAEFVNPVQICDLVPVSLGGMADHTYLVILIDKVAVKQSVSGNNKAARKGFLGYPSFSRSAGKTGSCGRLSESRRNMAEYDRDELQRA